MFLITCPVHDTKRLASIHGIREQANTPYGVLTVINCRCGGAAILRDGDQVAHHAPDADTVVASAPAPAVAAA